MTGLGVDKISRRAGHDMIQTTMGYVKQAEDLTGDLGAPFGPLPASLVATADSVSPFALEEGEHSHRTESEVEGGLLAHTHKAISVVNADDRDSSARARKDEARPTVGQVHRSERPSIDGGECCAALVAGLETLNHAPARCQVQDEAATGHAGRIVSPASRVAPLVDPLLDPLGSQPIDFTEREKGFEPSTSTLAKRGNRGRARLQPLRV
jgi:hypothetical protein